MDVRVQKSGIDGALCAMPSKSYAHRYLFAAALSGAETKILGAAACEDTLATIRCLQAMNASALQEGADATVKPSMAPDVAVFNCGESGTTLRFLLPVAAARVPDSLFAGKGRLSQRPLGDLLHCLLKNGMQAEGQGLPLRLKGRLQPGVYELPGNVSSQYISGLLLALPLLGGPSQIRLSNALLSKPYVDMTIGVLKEFGVFIQETEYGYAVEPQSYTTPGVVVVPGDWSSAAFLLAAGALHGSVRVSGLRQDGQGDRRIIALLKEFGANVRVQGDQVAVEGGALRGICADVGDIPDLLPILSVLGACARGRTVLTGAARLRLKESDRLQAMADVLGSMGIRVELQEDQMTIFGGEIRGATVSSHGDHRIAMAACIAALSSGDTVITGAECVQKSYPKFFEDVRALGGKIDVPG